MLACQVFRREYTEIWEEKIYSYTNLRKYIHRWRENLERSEKVKKKHMPCVLLPMEGNVLKIHRKFPESNHQRLREVIALTLFDVKGDYSGKNMIQAAS